MWQWEGEWLGGASDLSQLSVIGVTSGLAELITVDGKSPHNYVILCTNFFTSTSKCNGHMNIDKWYNCCFHLL